MSTSELTSIFELLKKTESMKIYDLEFERFYGMPSFPPLIPGYVYQIHRQHQTSYDPEKEGERTGASGLVVMSDHSGTHVDALCHQAVRLKIHDDIEVGPEVQTPWGFKVHGAEKIPPIVKRGILLDIPASKNQQILPEKYQITPTDLEEALRMTGTKVLSNDIVLVRTGYGKFWNDAEKFKNYASVSKEGTLWFDDKEIFGVGIDNLSWDPPGVRDPITKSSHFAHINLLVERGKYIFENVFLEELSLSKCYEFLFLAFPIKLKGATGAPVRPVALGMK